MAWVVPRALEDAVYGAAREVLGDVLGIAALTRAITLRSERYTSDREHLASSGAGDLAARAVFFTIADAMKIAIPIGELARRDALPAARPLRVVDVGAGCGAMTLGLAAAFAETPQRAGQGTRPSASDLIVTAIDRDARALAIAKAAASAFAAGRVTMTTRVGDVTRVALPPADLIVLGTVVNELPHEEGLALVERAIAATSEDGAVIVVEPALRETSRGLHAIRDAVIARGSACVFAPCTRRSAPCPALADPDDWCHEDRAIQLPPRTANLARLTHLRDGGMKFAYLVLRRRPLDLVAAGDAAWRVVSAPRPAKGKLELIGCSAHGRIPLRLLKRNRASANRDFEHADRGDVLEIAAAPDEARVEVADDTAVAIRSLRDQAG